MKKLLIIPLLLISIFLSANVNGKSVVTIKIVQAGPGCTYDSGIIVTEKDGSVHIIELDRQKANLNSLEVSEKLIHETLSKYLNSGFKIESHAGIGNGCIMVQTIILTKDE